MVFLGQCEAQLCNCPTWGTQRFAAILSVLFSPFSLQETGTIFINYGSPCCQVGLFRIQSLVGNNIILRLVWRGDATSVQLLHRALCWRPMLKLLVCSSCSSVWFHSRSEIPVWSPQGSLSSLAGDLKQQEFGLSSFSKAQTCANPYLSPVLCLIHLLILPLHFGWAFLFPSLYRKVNRCRDISQSWSSVCCMHKEVLGKHFISKMDL